MLNLVSEQGHLTRDAEMKTIGSKGTPLVSFSIGNDSWFGQKHTNFFNVEMMGKRAESVFPYLKKGTGVIVTGKLKQDRWEDKDGNKRSKIIIQADNVDLLPRGNSGTSNDQPPEDNDNPDTDDVAF